MAKKENGESFRKGITIETVGGLLVAILTGLASYWFGLLPYIKRFLITFWEIVTKPVAIPLWLIVLVSLFIVYRVIITIRNFLSGNIIGEHLSYTNDFFWGVKWRWNYPVTLYNVRPYCPHCDTVLIYEKKYSYEALSQFFFVKLAVLRFLNRKAIGSTSEERCLDKLIEN